MKSIMIAILALSSTSAFAFETQCPEGQEAYDYGNEGGGVICRLPAQSVSCEVIGWVESHEGEGAPVLRPVLGECTPSGGFGGDGARPDEPQAP